MSKGKTIFEMNFPLHKTQNPAFALKFLHLQYPMARHTRVKVEQYSFTQTRYAIVTFTI